MGFSSDDTLTLLIHIVNLSAAVSYLGHTQEFDPGLPGALSSVSPAEKLLETWGQIKKVQ